MALSIACRENYLLFRVSLAAEAAESTLLERLSAALAIVSFCADAVESITLVTLSLFASEALSLLQATKPRLATANTMKSFFIVFVILIFFEIFHCLYPDEGKVTLLLKVFFLA